RNCKDRGRDRESAFEAQQSRLRAEGAASRSGGAPEAPGGLAGETTTAQVGSGLARQLDPFLQQNSGRSGSWTCETQRSMTAFPGVDTVQGQWCGTTATRAWLPKKPSRRRNRFSAAF